MIDVISIVKFAIEKRCFDSKRKMKIMCPKS